MLARLSILLLVGLLAGCGTTHLNAPTEATAVPETRYRVERGIVYSGGDAGPELRADVYTPITLGPYPTLLMVPGGGWEGGSPGDMAVAAEYFAARGIAVVAVAHRGAGAGVGLSEQLQDLHAALRWMRRNAAVHRFDMQRLAAFGFESGGHLAALLGLAQSARQPLPGLPRDVSLPPLRAVVAGAAPLNLLPAADRADVRRLLPDTAERSLMQASPVFAAHAEAPPFFLFHGGRDSRWPIDGAEAMFAELEQRGVPVELYRMKGRGHTTTYLTVGSALAVAAEFLWRELD